MKAKHVTSDEVQKWVEARAKSYGTLDDSPYFKLGMLYEILASALNEPKRANEIRREIAAGK